MAKILNGLGSFGKKLNLIESLFLELNVEFTVEGEVIIFIDNDTNTKVRLSRGPDYRDNTCNFPRRFDDEQFYSLGE